MLLRTAMNLETLDTGKDPFTIGARPIVDVFFCTGSCLRQQELAWTSCSHGTSRSFGRSAHEIAHVVLHGLKARKFLVAMGTSKRLRRFVDFTLLFCSFCRCTLFGHFHVAFFALQDIVAIRRKVVWFHVRNAASRRSVSARRAAPTSGFVLIMMRLGRNSLLPFPK